MKTFTAKSPWTASSRKRQTKFAVKQDSVLKAAARVFRERGFESTSLNEIAEAIDITKPTLYHYVKNKDDLIRQIMLAGQDEIFAIIESGEKNFSRPYEQLRDIMIKCALFMTTDYGACSILVPPRSMAPEARDAIHSRVEQINQRLYRILAAGQASGELEVSDVVLTYHALFGSLHWIAFWFDPKGRLPAQQVAEMQVDMLLNGVGGEMPSQAATRRPPSKNAAALRSTAAAKKQQKSKRVKA